MSHVLGSHPGDFETVNTYDLSNLNILLAERTPLMRGQIRRVLRELGVREVRDVSSAEAAYDHFKQAPSDLLFTDWSPSLDGIGLIQEIRTGVHTPKTLLFPLSW